MSSPSTYRLVPSEAASSGGLPASKILMSSPPSSSTFGNARNSNRHKPGRCHGAPDTPPPRTRTGSSSDDRQALTCIVPHNDSPGCPFSSPSDTNLRPATLAQAGTTAPDSSQLANYEHFNTRPFTRKERLFVLSADAWVSNASVIRIGYLHRKILSVRCVDDTLLDKVALVGEPAEVGKNLHACPGNIFAASVSSLFKGDA